MTPESLRDTITELYLEHGRYHTVKELAAFLSVTPQMVRKHLRDRSTGGHLAQGIDSMSDYQETYSRDYPMMQSGMVKVEKYGPARRHLRAMILALRSSTITTEKKG